MWLNPHTLDWSTTGPPPPILPSKHGEHRSIVTMVPAQPQACRRESLFPFQLLMIAEWLSSLPEPSTMQTLCTQNARTSPPTYSSSSVAFYIYPRPSIIIVLLFHVSFFWDTIRGRHYLKICSDLRSVCFISKRKFKAHQGFLRCILFVLTLLSVICVHLADNSSGFYPGGCSAFHF